MGVKMQRAIFTAAFVLVLPLFVFAVSAAYQVFTDNGSGTDLARFTVDEGATRVNAYFENSNLGIGTSSPSNVLHITSDGNGGVAGVPTVLLTGNSNKERFEIQSFGSPGAAFQGCGASGTFASPGATANASALAIFAGRGYDNAGTPAQTDNQVILRMVASEAFTTGAQGTHMQFETTAVGTTSRSEKMRLDGNGNLGIGTTAPAYDLHVYDDSSHAELVLDDSAQAWKLRANNSTGSLVILDETSGTARMKITAGSDANTLVLEGGNVGIGTGTTSAKLHVEGDSRVDGHLSAANTAINDLMVINATEVYTDPSGHTYGHYMVNYTDTTVSVSRIVHGAMIYGIARPSTGTTNSGTCYGIRGTARLDGAGTMSKAYGGYYVAQSNNASGTITNAYGLYARTLQNTGTITNGYGLYIGTIDGTNTWGVYQADANATNYFAGNVGIGDSAPSSKLQVAGAITPGTDDLYDLGSSGLRWDDVYATNGVIQTSDRRLKKDIKALNYGLDEIRQLEAVSYLWKDNPAKGNQIGLIAQDVQSIIPEMVDVGEGPEKRLGLRYDNLVPVLINAVQQLDRLVESQATYSKEQQRQIEAQRSQMEVHTQQYESLLEVIEVQRTQIELLQQEVAELKDQ